MHTDSGRLAILAVLVALGPPVAADNGQQRGEPVPVQQVQSRMTQLEEQLGPWAPELAEPSAELGMMLLNGGAHADARKAFRRAMQIERINTGLYTPRQLPFLDLAIESSVAAGDWKQVDDDFRYYEWLNYRIHEQGPALIDALDRVIEWHLAAVHLDAEINKGNHLLRLLELGERRLVLTEQYYPRGHARHLEDLYQLAVHLYYINIAAQRAGPVSDKLIENLTSPIDHRRSFFLAQEQLSDDCYKKGRQLLQRALEAARAAPGFTSEAEGTGLVYLADWELMFNHESRAEQMYRQAFDALMAAGVPAEALAHRFGTPALLPEPELRLGLDAGPPAVDGIHFIPWAREVPGVQFPKVPDAELPVDPVEHYALARFHVEENGWAENIRIVEVRPEDKALFRAARNAFWYAQFRPRIEDGRLVATQNVEARYLPLE